MRPSVEVATSVFPLHAHLVPDPVFAAAQLDRMEEIMRVVCADFGCELVEFNGEAKPATSRSRTSPHDAIHPD